MAANPTGQVIVTGSLTKLGLVEQGGAPSPSDSTVTLTELNAMWDSWSIDDGLISSIVSSSVTLVSGTASYTIGAGAAFNIPRPTRIYQAIFAAAGNRNELDIVASREYYRHNDLGASAKTPDQFYPDFNVDPSSGYMTGYLWPVPTGFSGSPTLELEVGVPFVAWSLVTAYSLPYGYQDAIQNALAYRMVSFFGGLAQGVIQSVTELGQKAELRIREMNKMNRQMEPGTEMLQPPQPAAAGRQ